MQVALKCQNLFYMKIIREFNFALKFPHGTFVYCLYIIYYLVCLWYMENDKQKLRPEINQISTRFLIQVLTLVLICKSNLNSPLYSTGESTLIHLWCAAWVLTTKSKSVKYLNTQLYSRICLMDCNRREERCRGNFVCVIIGSKAQVVQRAHDIVSILRIDR